MIKHKNWHRLDNSAKIYPLIASRGSQNLFRLTAEMKSPVKPDCLQKALYKIMPRYSVFNVSLKRGIFWHYFEELDGRPYVVEDSDLLIRPINNLQTGGFNFRVSYFKNRIAVDFFHAICDGSGGLEFLKTLVYQYLLETGENIDAQESVILPTSPVRQEEEEDSFLKYADNIKLKDIKNIGELKGSEAYKIPGYRFDFPGMGVIQGVTDSDALLKLARENKVTVTAYIGALVLYSIYKTKIKDSIPKESLQLFVPINLRKIFPSSTLLNFSLFSRIGFKIDGKNLTFEDFLSLMTESLKRDTNKEKLKKQIDTTVKAEKFLPIRILPLLVKQVVFRMVQNMFGNNKKTLTFSNLGVVKMPDDMKKYVERFTFMLGNNKEVPLSLTVITSCSDTVITFGRLLRDTDVEKFFFRFLADKGLNIKIYSNVWEDGGNEM